VSNLANSGRVLYAALLPHAPILVPVVSGKREVEVASSIAAMREAARRAVATGSDAIVVISPHSPRETKAFGIWTGERLVGTLKAFGAPHEGIDLPSEGSLVETIAQVSTQRRLPTVSITEPELDHGATVPLWFVAEAGWRGPIVVLGLNSTDHFNVVALGEAVAEAAASAGRHITLIASGDMSHRLTPDAPCGFSRRGLEFDQWLIDILQRGEYHELLKFDPKLEQEAAQDVLDPVLVALGAVGFGKSGAEVLNYEGPFGVGYGVAILYSDGENPSQSDR
jgi:MEMO1 family protein